MIENSWFKSTRSGAAGHCVEVFWKKSTRSNPSGNCVEVKADNGKILVRDTKLGEASPILEFSEDSWAYFIGEIREGWDWPGKGEIATLPANYQNDVQLYADKTGPNGPSLHFTRAEWDAFVGGVHNGEFDLQPA